jgi:prolyl oligopeptidase
VSVTDPYRWLEDQNSTRTRRWLEQQEAHTRAYFESLSSRDSIRRRVIELVQTTNISDPWNVGERFFYLKRYRDAEQPTIVMSNGLEGEEITLVDPACYSLGKSSAVTIVAISADGRFMAFSVRKSGTDHSSIGFIDVESKELLPETLEDGFCRGLAFAPDSSGFYYSHRKVQDPRPHYQAVFWHSFDTALSKDQEVFFAGERPDLFLGIRHSFDGKMLAYVVFSAGKQRRTSLFLYRPWEKYAPTALLKDVGGAFVPFFARGQLLAYTDWASPNYRIVRIDPDRPDPTNWSVIVPECKRRIQQFSVAGDRVFITRADRFSTKIESFGLDGTCREDILISCCGSVDLVNRPTATNKLLYSQTSVSQPPAICVYDARTGKHCLWRQTGIPLRGPTVFFEETTYSSKDGTQVPLFLAVRKDLMRRGPLPTFLTGYGGFGTCMTPRFSAFATYLVERGFLFAVPAIRGGGELGEQWHLSAKRHHRQNAFDDFTAAAEWLSQQGLAERKQIAIGGGSNAGLLVGAAITQRPELFRAAICLGPLLDMIRFHHFDFGAGWADEYGSPEDEEDFRSLYAYSPYHHVFNGQQYPALLIISGDSDTRCNPMHARKMTALLQSATGSGRPVLLDYRPGWGHMPVQPFSAKTEALTDRLAFICRELGIHVPTERIS